jgi:hypothetical protein
MELRMDGMVFQTTPHLICLHKHVGEMDLIGKVKVGCSQFRFSMNTGLSQFRLITLNYVQDTEKFTFYLLSCSTTLQVRRVAAESRDKAPALAGSP